MKYVIASDIHGSASACRKLIEAFEAEKADRLLLLGDLLYHGPRNALPDAYDPQAVITLLNGISHRVAAVRGNCDCEVDQMVLNFPILADYSWVTLGERLLYLTHGHRVTEDTFRRIGAGNVLVQGHTHVPMAEEVAGVLHINPGSTSIPKEGSDKSYLVCEKGVFSWKRLETQETYRTYDL